VLMYRAKGSSDTVTASEGAVASDLLGLYVLAIYSVSVPYADFAVLGNFKPISLTAIVYIPLMLLMMGRLAIDTLLRRSHSGANLYQIVGWSLLTCMAVFHALWYPQIARAGGEADFWSMAAMTLLLPLLMWLIGLSIGRVYENVRDVVSTRFILWTVFLALAAPVLYGVVASMVRYGVVILLFKNYETGQSFNYLALGDILAMWSLLLMGAYRRIPRTQLLVYVIASGLLFFSFSRASFYLFLAWGGIYLWLSVPRPRSVVGTIAGPVLSAVVLGAVLLVLSEHQATIGASPLLNRMISIVVNLGADSSFRGRTTLLSEGWAVLRHDWLLGRYMSEWWQTGLLGDYIHNWLSFLAAYGIIPFVSFVALVVALIGRARALLARGRGPLPLITLLFCMSAIILARSYVWSPIWFALGFVATYRCDAVVEAKI